MPSITELARAETNERVSAVPKDKKEWLDWRRKDLTSTDIAKVMGLAPKSYGGGLATWHEKKTDVSPEFHVTDRMELGLDLEEGIANNAARREGWTIRNMKEYIRIPSLRLGSSFDFCTVEDGQDKAIIEVKLVDFIRFREDWITHDDGEIEASIHIELQAQHELLVSGFSDLYLAVLTGSDVRIIHRQPDPAIQTAIYKAAAEFWRSIDADEPPAADFGKDIDFIKSLYSHAEPGKYLDATERQDIWRLADAHRIAHQDFKLAEAAKKAAAAELLTLIGDHEKVFGNGFTVSAGLVGPARVEYDRKGYRNLKITFKKEKK